MGRTFLPEVWAQDLVSYQLLSALESNSAGGGWSTLRWWGYIWKYIPHLITWGIQGEATLVWPSEWFLFSFRMEALCCHLHGLLCLFKVHKICSHLLDLLCMLEVNKLCCHLKKRSRSAKTLLGTGPINPPASSGSPEHHASWSEPQCRATNPIVSHAAPSADFDKSSGQAATPAVDFDRKSPAASSTNRWPVSSGSSTWSSAYRKLCIYRTCQ
jgi:hypothetical protein